MTNDAFYFGILPILTEAAGNYGIAPVEMARAPIVGQPVHMTSPLVPALLLLHYFWTVTDYARIELTLRQATHDPSVLVTYFKSLVFASTKRSVLRMRR